MTTIKGRVDMGEKVIVNIETLVDGHNPPDRVHAGMFLAGLVSVGSFSE